MTVLSYGNPYTWIDGLILKQGPVIIEGSCSKMISHPQSAIVHHCGVVEDCCFPIGTLIHTAVTSVYVVIMGTDLPMGSTRETSTVA